MVWEKKENTRLPIKSWCGDIEDSAMEQAVNLANHSQMFSHIAIMPDCHRGYGMPIGGVIACEDSIIPNAVGVDIGCGMGAVETDIPVSLLSDKKIIRDLLNRVKAQVPVGEGVAHVNAQKWNGFEAYLSKEENPPAWLTERVWKLAQLNLGTLGGGNHFIEMQSDESNNIWLMLHSGSRNLGYKIAEYYNRIARESHEGDLAYLAVEANEGKAYIRDMTFAMDYAAENRRKMMSVFKSVISEKFPDVCFRQEINIHHNYASLENHFGKNVWVHRKGATSAKKNEMGIIPGSMGTSSYIVKGLGNRESFMSCSHGAGRVMSRMQACRELTVEKCSNAMGDVVYDRWHKMNSKFRRKKKNQDLYDFGESPLAYKDIDMVINSELDLITPLVKLRPLGVIKG